MKVVDASIKNPITVAVGVILLVMFGLIALFRIPVQLTPNVDKAEITVNTMWPGASPQEVEREIIDEQEDVLKSVEGLVEMKSESFLGRGRVTLQFQVGTDPDAALLKVSNSLNQVPQYPDEAQEPVLVSSGSEQNAIAWIVLERLSGDHSNIATEYQFVKDYIKPRFERIPGVAESEIFGGIEPEMQVIFDPDALAAHYITLAEVAASLSQENENISAGDFDEGKRRFITRTVGQFRSPADVANVVIKYVNGAPIYVRDVAAVRLGYAKETAAVYEKDRQTIAINCKRQTGANVLLVMQGIRQAIKEMNSGLLRQRGLRLRQVYDETEYIDSAIELVRQNLVLGGSLAVLVLLLFLRSLTSTLIIATAIPISIVGTFLLMSFFGRNINVISLAGLAFAVGMVVDAAIVVLENIDRHRGLGEDRLQAASAGTIEVWGAVLASTLTTMAVFIPVVFVKEEAGQLFRDIAIAISCAVALSLTVSITVIPSLAAKILGIFRDRRLARAPYPEPGKAQLSPVNPRQNPGHTPGREKPAGFLSSLLRPVDVFAHWFTEGIASLNYHITGSLGARLFVVVILTVFSLAMAFFLAPKTEYLPEGNRNFVFSILLPPPGYNLDELSKVGEEIVDHLRPYWQGEEKPDGSRQFKEPRIRNLFYVALGRLMFAGASTKDPLKARSLVPVFMRKLRKLPGFYATSYQTSLFGRGISSGRTIDLDITGPDLERLIELGARVFFQAMQLLPGSQIRPIPSLDLASPEIRIIPDRVRASSLGLSARDIGLIVDSILDGRKVSDYQYEGREIDLTLMGRKAAIQRTQDFQDLLLRAPDGRLVTLGSVAHIRWVAGPTQINHIERQRAITIQVRPPREIPLEEAMDTLKTRVIGPLQKSGELGGLYNINLSGTADDLVVTRRALQWNFVLALIITYLLMAALFASFLYPFVIMLSVPLAAAGGFAGLWLVSHFIEYQALDVLTMLGFVILVGTVVNNAILIVHQSLNHIRHEGMERRAAIREAVRNRIRPIFMSTTTSVFGMLPLVLFRGAGSELYRGLGSVVVGGLVLSTIFTLFLIPALFSLVLDARVKIAGKIS
ncbi:MAG: efflux RND transporter permease subunit [Deltaproteobacteria bacterium]|nr:efflux RND transporter permease subunit [Deltaproteobacteria bacterium]MBW2071303.1 efflux RND transporter permease subunit [Deltaproteobacteria bacterium]